MTDLFIVIGKLFTDAFPIQWSPEMERLRVELRQPQQWYRWRGSMWN